jgi:RNA polymerase sigma-70 factor (ECF subfamily)
MAVLKTQLTPPDVLGELELETVSLKPSAAVDQDNDKQAMLDSERERIFGDWLAAHKGILFKVVRAYAFEHADRQDLLQEVAIQVWRSVDAYRGDSSVPTWVYRIALNAAISWTRKQDRHRRGRQSLRIVDGLVTASAAEADPRVEWLYRQIAELKKVDRSVALLMLDGFSYKEIAAIVGISESNVGVKINRIKAALTAQLAKETEL